MDSKKAFALLLRFVWELPQSLFALLLLLTIVISGKLKRIQFFKEVGSKKIFSLVINHEARWLPTFCSGIFIFMNLNRFIYSPDLKGWHFQKALLTQNSYERVLRHEFGHNIQSLILGPLYLFTVGIVSVTLNIISTFMYKVLKKSYAYVSLFYYSTWPESWAEKYFTKTDKVLEF